MPIKVLTEIEVQGRVCVCVLKTGFSALLNHLKDSI